MDAVGATATASERSAPASTEISSVSPTSAPQQPTGANPLTSATTSGSLPHPSPRTRTSAPRVSNQSGESAKLRAQLFGARLRPRARSRETPGCRTRSRSCTSRRNGIRASAFSALPMTLPFSVPSVWLPDTCAKTKLGSGEEHAFADHPGRTREDALHRVGPFPLREAPVQCAGSRAGRSLRRDRRHAGADRGRRERWRRALVAPRDACP